MKICVTFFLIVLITLLIRELHALDLPDSIQLSKPRGAYLSRSYQNLFIKLLGKSELQIQTKITNTFNQLFYGDDSTQRLYYPIDSNMAYIKDIYNNVCTEGMSYGMMVAVQLDKKNEFDRL
jgi:oligosaccharide reducing-end xylanase